MTVNNQSGGAVVLRANGLSRVFDINPGDTSLATPATVTFNGTAGGITIANGAASPGDAADGSGGGILAGGPTTTLANTEVKGNTAGEEGGGVFADGTTLTITGSTFADNVAATAGGGLEIETTGGNPSGSTITKSTITGNSVLNNNSTGAGGGIGAGISGFLANSSGGSFAFTVALTLLNDTLHGQHGRRRRDRLGRC